jgi:hypothetical protein
MTTEPADDFIETCAALLELVRLAADIAAIDAINAGKTSAEVTRLAVAEAFKCALGNGLIVVVDRELWPDLIASGPPYKP